MITVLLVWTMTLVSLAFAGNGGSNSHMETPLEQHYGTCEEFSIGYREKYQYYHPQST